MVPLFGIAARWLHLLAAASLVGVFACLVFVARPAARAAGAEASERILPALDRWLVTLGGAALAAAFATGLLDLWRQTSVATGLGLRDSLTVASLRAVLLETQYGTAWLVRHALLGLAAVLFALRAAERDARDWIALRLEAILLAGLSLALLAGAGHAASAQRLPPAALAADAVHLLATGVWFGGLLPLAAVLRAAAALPGAAGALMTAEAARCFSALGLASVAALAATGAYNAWEQIGSVPALVGTPYGHWLLVKLALLLGLLGLAAVNLLILKPRLLRAAGAAAGADPAAAARLRRQVLGEALLGATLLAVVAVLGLTTPARHAVVDWPFSFRLSWEATRAVPGVQTRVAIGSQVALFGLVAALLGVIVRRRRWPWVAGAGLVAIGLGLAVALPPLAVDAYPTTYLRPTVPYTAASIASGRALYEAHCAACHGVAGYGDGPAASGLRPRPADLTAKHAADHTVGDLFWWLSRGIKGSAMPGFGDRLTEEERWDLINFVRTLAAAEQARGLGPVVDPRLAVVAPDFAYTPGIGDERSLKDYRGRRMVLLVFFTLPGSAPRLVDLATAAPALTGLGVQLLGVPVRAPGDVYRARGSRPVFFPLAVDGATDAVAAYRPFRRDLSAESDGPDLPPVEHLELLVDRQGYLRARWVPAAGDGWADPARLLAEVERLAGETPRTVIADDHVH